MSVLSKLGVDHDKPVQEWREILSKVLSEHEEVCYMYMYHLLIKIHLPNYRVLTTHVPQNWI